MVTLFSYYDPKERGLFLSISSWVPLVLSYRSNLVSVNIKLGSASVKLSEHSSEAVLMLHVSHLE